MALVQLDTNDKIPYMWNKLYLHKYWGCLLILFWAAYAVQTCLANTFSFIIERNKDFENVQLQGVRGGCSSKHSFRQQPSISNWHREEKLNFKTVQLCKMHNSHCINVHLDISNAGIYLIFEINETYQQCWGWLFISFWVGCAIQTCLANTLSSIVNRNHRHLRI
jgi:hypothetical protein